MKSLLFVSLLLGELFLISTGQGVIYCVKPNSPTATCSPEDHCQQCQTLQYYFDNVNTTINPEKNATMIFMDGSHRANISSTAIISAPTLNITAKGKTTTVTLIMQNACQKISCRLTFKSTHLSMDNLKIKTLLKDGRKYNDIRIYAIVINATKVSLHDCTFKSAEYQTLYNFVVNVSHATDILLKDCIFDDYNFIGITNSYKANLMSTEHTLESNVTLEHCTFNSNRTSLPIQIADVKYTMLKKCTFSKRSELEITDVKHATLKDCTFTDSKLEITDEYYEITDEHYEITDEHYAMIQHCTFNNTSVGVSGLTTVIISKCTGTNFASAPPDTNWGFFDINIVLKDVRLKAVDANINKCNVNITGDSSFSDSTIVSDSSAITMSGNISIRNQHGQDGAMFLDSSNLTIAAGTNVIFFNNSALNRGGAMSLMFSVFCIETGASVKFINNSANDKGGAIYVQPGISSVLHGIPTSTMKSKCLFQLIEYNSNSETYILFANNSAGNGGDDIYGATLEDCNFQTDLLQIDRTGTPSISSVSSDSQRVCLCDNHGAPQCNRILNVHTVHPGESFTVPAVIVGWDYQNTTTGVVHADFLHDDSNYYIVPILDSNSQRGHVISNSKQCTNLTFTLYSKPSSTKIATMYITTVYMDSESAFNDFMDGDVCNLPDLPTDDQIRCRNKQHLTPVFFNIRISSCPVGFKFLQSNQSCECYSHDTLFDSCRIMNGIGYFSWSKTVWVSIEEDALLYSTHCPFDYCDITGKDFNLQNDSDSQCAFNRAGRLCGGCKENYSLAIGSSHCIHCSNNNNLALLIFFAAAGFLLVFFISAFNLTVTQGMINGLIFYANIVWTYQSIFFPQELEPNPVLTFLKTFVAWINLDFGIETCFVDGLDALWKTVLQFIFPFYIWIIAGLIIMAAKYSTRLTNLLGNRAVPVLGTLFLLSYVKLLQTSSSIMDFSIFTWDNQTVLSKSVVWSIDGNVDYTDLRHILLLVAGLATLLFFLLPYTMLLFLIQCLRKISHFCLLKWIMKFHPVYDAYFAPLKHKHQYWFGVLLLARVVLLTMFVSTFNVPQSINIFILFIVVTVLHFFMILLQPYKNTAILVLQSSFLVNIILLSGSLLFAEVKDTTNEFRPRIKTAAVMTSTGVVFLQFCGILLYQIIAPWCSSTKSSCCPHKQADEVELDNDDDDSIADSNADYRDSILNESQPILPTY